jgi:D-amino-acid dehydrogenase
VTVIGAGIVGVCCAVWLQRNGCKVTVIDRDEPGRGATYGNAGMLQVDSCVPLGTPGIVGQVPGMLVDPLGPLAIRWGYLPRIAPWLLRFIAASRPARVEEISIALTALLGLAAGTYRDLVAGTSAEDLLKPTGTIFVYATEAGFEAARFAHELRRRRDIKHEELRDGEIRQLEPALSPAIKRAVFAPDCMQVADPMVLTQRIAEKFAGNGGTILRETVTDIRIGPDGPTHVVTDAGEHDVDRLVLAAGAWSRRFANQLGARVPLDTERGYHLMLPKPGIELRMPIIAGERKIGITPMLGGVRLAGTVEFGGLERAPDYRRARILSGIAKEFVPGLEAEDAAEWMGFRPSMPDSLPVIGPSPRYKNAFFAFGHGHSGLTLGAVTGNLIADLVMDRAPPIDLRPYRADRF